MDIIVPFQYHQRLSQFTTSQAYELLHDHSRDTGTSLAGPVAAGTMFLPLPQIFL